MKCYIDVDDLGFAEEFCICFDLVQCSASPERLDGNICFLSKHSEINASNFTLFQQASKVDWTPNAFHRGADEGAKER